MARAGGQGLDLRVSPGRPARPTLAAMLRSPLSPGARVAVPARDAERVQTLLAGSVENLLATWSAEHALFNFTSRMAGDRVVSEYRHEVTVRYTINALLGLLEAARNGVPGLSEDDARVLVEAFLAVGPDRIVLPADQGLLTVLLARLGATRATLAARAAEAGRLLGAPGHRLNAQDVAWLAWGGAAAAAAGVATGRDVLRRGLERLEGELIEPATGLPRHTTSGYRRGLVSFGAVVYTLRALHEAASGLGDPRAAARFEQGVARVLTLQGRWGEWPWLVAPGSGRVVDRYPLFAVHQDSMAMLVLHPAADRGIPGAAAAAHRSLAWGFGDNELGADMYRGDPLFFAYRAIERAERAPRARRYARSLRPSPHPVPARALRINRECRSYHLGWILFAWAARPEAARTA
jgi:hypothetical protein